MQIQGLPMPKDGAIIPPAIPRGVRMGSILPLHSPAMSSGPISDNFIQDMMQEMGGGGGMPGLPPGLLGGGGPSAPPAPKKVKEKKKK
jgi:signal recognition particle subunit SRP19